MFDMNISQSFWPKSAWFYAVGTWLTMRMSLVAGVLTGLINQTQGEQGIIFGPGITEQHIDNDNIIVCNIIQCSTIQYNMTQYKAIQYNTKQYNTI